MNRNEYLAKPDETLQKHVECLIRNLDILLKNHYIDETIYELIKIACLHHDDGKANPEFQKRIRTKSKFNEEKEIPHNILSAYLFNPNECKNQDDYYKILYSILYHHDYVENIDSGYLNSHKKLIEELLEDFDCFKVKRRTIEAINQLIENMNSDAIRIKGLLNKCDYAASGKYEIEYPNNFLISSLDNMIKKWRAYNPLSDWNDLQKFCIENRDKNLIIVGQTGMGKTEAGLQWIGNNKGYFILPLRTAINAIYDRVRYDVLLDESINQRLSLLHSESLSYYTKNINDDYDLYDYEKRGKHLSMPLNISTMDQLFDFAFKYKGYEMKLATFSYSKIVIDEIQMYDPALLAYLLYGLGLIAKMGGKVNIMTATLAPFLKDLIKQYIPVEAEATFTNDLIRHNIKTIKKELNAKDIIQFYKSKEYTSSCKVLVICNTVAKAQEIYKEIRHSGVDNIHILHSRFTRKERSNLEKEIKEFGKTYDNLNNIDNDFGIWITTQVVEASMDIDFDYLFTELQDLNSLIQRLGRCNRKGVKNIKEANCFIYSVINEKLITRNIRTGKFFIDPDLYYLSKEAIESVDGIITESDKNVLIDKYLTSEKLKDSDYLAKFYDEMKFIQNIYPYQYAKGEKRLRNILSNTVIPSPIYLKNEEEIERLKAGVNDKKIPYIDRIQKKSDFMEYTVSVPHYYIENYLKAVGRGTATYYSPIEMDGETIYILECEYDEFGLNPIKFKKEKEGAMFL